jgi:hypothetical protein
MMRGFALPIGMFVIGTAAILAYGFLVPLPRYFAYSDAVFLGALAVGLTWGLSLMLPERMLFTTTERLRHAFMARHGVSEDRTDTALDIIARAQQQAKRLIRADNGFVPELAVQVDHTSDSLNAIARLVFHDPSEVRRHLPLVNRADLLVEAVENHSRLRATQKASDAQLASARTSVSAALDAFAGAMSAADERRIEAQITEIDTASDVADSLFKSMKGPRR